jgi:hypothetical protein
VAEDLRRDDVALELLQADEQEHHPEGAQRILEQRDRDGRDRAEDRADERDQLHHAEEDAERERVGPSVGEDADDAEYPERDAGGRTHDHAERELPADVARYRPLHARRVVVERRAVPGRQQPPHERADLARVDEQVDGDHEDQHD